MFYGRLYLLAIIIQPCSTYFIAEVTLVIEREKLDGFCIRIPKINFTLLTLQRKLLNRFNASYCIRIIGNSMHSHTTIQVRGAACIHWKDYAFAFMRLRYAELVS